MLGEVADGLGLIPGGRGLHDGSNAVQGLAADDDTVQSPMPLLRVSSKGVRRPMTSLFLHFLAPSLTSFLALIHMVSCLAQ